MNNIIEIKNLNKKYRNFMLNIEAIGIRKGSITGMIGKNGAGKTTLLNCLMNVLDCTYDYYLFNEEKVAYSDYKFRSEIGYVGDSFDAYQTTKLRDITNFYKSVYGTSWNSSKYDSYLELFELDTNKKVSELSKGMKIKYQFALVLSRDIEFLLLDEPTSGLDPIIREEILEILKNKNHLNGLTILFSSHITEDIERIAANVIFLDNGSIVLDGTLKYIKERFKILDELPVDLKDSGSIIKQGEYYIIDTEIAEMNNMAEDYIEKLKECDLSQILIYLRGKNNEKSNC